MEKKKQIGYNFSSVDLLIYIWNKRVILAIVGIVAAVASIAISLTITPMFRASVIMFPASGASVARSLLVQNYSGRQSVYGFGEEEQAEQLLQVLHSEPIRTRIVDKYNLMEHYEIDPEGKYPLTELYETYKSNINFNLTEYMSVEISVMDKDPQIAADIANDISDLVDTVYNSMMQKRAISALELVEGQYIKSQEHMALMQDSLERISLELKNSIKTSGDAANNLIAAVAEHGINYLTMANDIRQEIGFVMALRYRTDEARLEADQNLPHKFVVERAIPPEKKAYPNKSLIVIVSTLASLLFALIVLIVIDNIRARLAVLREE
jgi:uncharacterized protein involved in exopolysaccharide biosynthesis